MKKHLRKTVYRHEGYLMRSYAEVRWSQIMDALGIHWLYEPKSVMTRHGMYLPDFILPLAGVAVEVKGAGPTAEEIDKAQDASLELKMPIVIVFGDPSVDGVAVAGAYVMAIYGKAKVCFTLSELADLVLWNTDGDTWSKLIKACAKQKHNPTRHVGEVLDEIFIGDAVDGFSPSLSESNKFRRDAAAEQNSRRSLDKASQSLVEFSVSEFSRVVVSHTDKLTLQSRASL